jgi:hypothetical protein
MMIEELDGPAVSALGVRAEPKQCSLRPVIGWVTKINYLELLRASEGTLSRWSRLHFQSLTPPPVSGSLSGRRPVVKIIAESIHNMIKNMLY